MSKDSVKNPPVKEEPATDMARLAEAVQSKFRFPGKTFIRFLWGDHCMARYRATWINGNDIISRFLAIFQTADGFIIEDRTK